MSGGGNRYLLLKFNQKPQKHAAHHKKKSIVQVNGPVAESKIETLRKKYNKTIDYVSRKLHKTRQIIYMNFMLNLIGIAKYKDRSILERRQTRRLVVAVVIIATIQKVFVSCAFRFMSHSKDFRELICNLRRAKEKYGNMKYK